MDYSIEYLYNECVLHRHCIRLHLKKDVCIDSKTVSDFYLMGFVLTSTEERLMLEKIITRINTFGSFRAFGFINNPIEEHIETIIETDNIDSIEFCNSGN